MRKNRHVGFMVERCRYNFRERVFAEQWKRENRRNPGVNHGYGILQDLFGRNGDRSGFRSIMNFSWRLIITRREEFIVATVIQWLGTNVGWCFLERCLNRCGYKIVEVDRTTHKEYYDPFVSDARRQNASAWYNIATQQNLAFEKPSAPLPVKMTTPYMERKHLMRPIDPEKRWGDKRCIRCGWEDKSRFPTWAQNPLRGCQPKETNGDKISEQVSAE